MALEPQWRELLPVYSRDENPVFADYQEYVINGELAQYRNIVQFGKKAGETLEAHILSGIGVLETLRPRLQLQEVETRTLYTAFTIHDINKALNDQRAFSKLAVSETLAQEIKRLKLDGFFPDWKDYLNDITSLVRAHSGHLHASGETLIAKHDPIYGLGLRRVNALIHLMRAADIIGLSHTLQERTHKATFLSHLNAYLADTGIQEQYVFHTHQLVEQRGLLTNVLHNALMEEFTEDADWLPLLLYPDGVAYLGRKGIVFDLNEDRLRRFGRRIDKNLSTILFSNPVDLFNPDIKQGIKIKPDALRSGVRFEELLRHARNLISRRKFKPTELEAKARKRASVPKAYGRESALAQALQTRLNDPTPFIDASEAQLRSAELARAYYIFLNDHFKGMKDIWFHIYRLLALPEDYFPLYECFDARYDRCYILAKDIAISEEDVYERIANDGQAYLDQVSEATTAQTGLEPENLWTNYLRLYLTLDDNPVSRSRWETHLAHYVKNQHKQCVHCSGPFKTVQWRKADVRAELDVQKFSNRLRGGGKDEPVKQICEVCRIQFLLEVVNYPTIQNEKTLYLHLFPYSFLTPPYVRGLVNAFTRLRNTDIVLQALNMDVKTAVEQVTNKVPLRPRFSDKAKGKAESHGILIPKYEDTVSSVLILPVSFPEQKKQDRTVERYLFALWNGLVLQRALNMKVLLSKDAVPPLTAEELPDLFLDVIPVTCAGLLRDNAYANRELDSLWQLAANLFGLKRQFFEDPTPDIVRAMTQGPLHVFFVVDRLIEKSGQLRLLERTFPYASALALEIGGDWMANLSGKLSQLAELAWKYKIRGKTWQRNSLLYPVSAVLKNMERLGIELDTETLKAATTQQIFDHLSRIRTGQRVGARTRDASRAFVDIWYDDVLNGIYRGNLQKLLRDEKLLRSAYLFYFQAQNPAKNKAQESED